MSFGERVKELRERCGLSQAAVAKGAGLTQVVVSRIETGKSPKLRPQDFSQLARSLGVSVHSLVPENATPDLMVRSKYPLTAEDLQRAIRKVWPADSSGVEDITVVFHSYREGEEFVTTVHIRLARGASKAIARGVLSRGPAVDHMIAAALAHPEWGCDRLAPHLAAEGIGISRSHVHNILRKRGLATRAERAVELQRWHDALKLSPEQVDTIEKLNPRFHERKHPASAPGELVAQDVMPLTRVRIQGGHGKLLIYSAVDSYSCYAFAAVCVPGSQPDPALDLLRDRVIPKFKGWDLTVRQVYMHEGRKHGRGGGQHYTEAYERFLAERGTRHIKGRDGGGRKDHSHGFATAFERDLKKGFLADALASGCRSLPTLQHELDKWLDNYNTQPIDGYPNLGRSPLDRIKAFLAASAANMTKIHTPQAERNS